MDTNWLAKTKMDFSNWLAKENRVLVEAAEQAFGLRDFVRMSGNRFGEYGRETALWVELDRACGEFRDELVKRGLWEDFASSLGMEA
jgi:hypothetical protein